MVQTLRQDLHDRDENDNHGNVVEEAADDEDREQREDWRAVAVAAGNTHHQTRRMGQDAIPAVITATLSTDARVRRAAAQILGRPRGARDQVREPLMRLLDDGDTEVRLAAAQALWDTHADARATVPVLREILDDNQAAVRLHAAKLLQWIGVRAYFAEDDLRKVLDEVPADVKPYVAGVLKVIDEE